MRRIVIPVRNIWIAGGAVLAVLIVVGGRVAGLHGNALIAFSLGSILSSALGIGLMALIFYSNRSGHDAEVSRVDGEGEGTGPR